MYASFPFYTVSVHIVYLGDMSDHLRLEESLNNPVNVAGISSFMTTDRGMDIREIEKVLVENEVRQTIQEAPVDIVSEFRKRLGSLEESLGISLGDGSPRRNRGDDEYDERGEHSDGEQSEKEDDQPSPRRDSFAQARYSPRPYDQRQHEPSRSRDRSVSFGAYEHRDSGYDQSAWRDRHSSGAGGAERSPGFSNLHNDPELMRMSTEQQKQYILQRALAGIGASPLSNGDKFSLDAMKMNDKKNNLLEQINMLRTSLTDDEVKHDDIPVVSMSNSLDEIENVYKQLRYRNDHARYCGFANEIAQVGAGGLEYLFDGEKKYFGVKPDLTGWSSTLNIKMRRLNYETSSIVGDCMRSNDLGNVSRLCLELIPSMILHMKMRSNKTGKTASRPSDKEVQNAINGIRNIKV